MRQELNIPNLTVFVISSSQAGAKEKNTANAIKLMSGPGVHHYWDGLLRVGSAVQPFVEGLDYPAWDFWMLYRPGVTWSTEKAPEPDWWEHQLGSLHRDFAGRRLDAQRFAEKARELAGPPARGHGSSSASGSAAATRRTPDLPRKESASVWRSHKFTQPRPSPRIWRRAAAASGPSWRGATTRSFATGSYGTVTDQSEVSPFSKPSPKMSLFKRNFCTRLLPESAT